MMDDKYTTEFINRECNGFDIYERLGIYEGFWRRFCFLETKVVGIRMRIITKRTSV